MEKPKHNDVIRAVLSTLLYWVLLLSFILSYTLTGSSISLVMVADRIIDAAGMCIALVSQRIVDIPPTSRLTYGYHRFESVSSFVLILVFILMLFYSGYISYSDLSGSVVKNQTLTIYASILSLAVLPLVSYLLAGNVNLAARTMAVHTIQDIITAAMALGGSVLLIFFRSESIDFLTSILIIIVSVLLNRSLIVKNMRLLMEGTDLDAEKIEKGLRMAFPLVHHTHIWDVCPHYRMATIHVYAEKDAKLEDLDDMRLKLSDYLADAGINHLTVQFEPVDDRH